MSSPGPWHCEGHYILSDSEPQEIICERVAEHNRALLVSAPELQAKIEALADALGWLLDDSEGASDAARDAAMTMLRSLGRIP